MTATSSEAPAAPLAEAGALVAAGSAPKAKEAVTRLSTSTADVYWNSERNMNPPWFGRGSWQPPSVGAAFLGLQQPYDPALALELALRRFGIRRIAEYRLE